MNRGFYADILGLNTQLSRMEIVSNNLVNAGASGFKRRVTEVSPFKEMLLVNLKGDLSSARPIGVLPQGSALAGVRTDFGAGVCVQTDNAGDLAIAGEGFFTLQDEDGQEYYTRNGEFFVDPGGYINHGAGLRLLGAGGPVQVPEDDFTVSASGQISAAGQEIDTILISSIEDPNLLSKSSNGLYTAPEGVEAGTVNDPQILQYHLEQSNVDFTEEVATAMNVLRAYEAGHKMVQAHDRLVDLAIREVGKIK